MRKARILTTLLRRIYQLNAKFFVAQCNHQQIYEIYEQNFTCMAANFATSFLADEIIIRQFRTN